MAGEVSGTRLEARQRSVCKSAICLSETPETKMQNFLGASFRSFSGRIIGAFSALVASFSITSSLTIDESGLFFLGLGFAIFCSHILKFGLDTYVLKKCAIFLSESMRGDFLALLLSSFLICIAGSLLFYLLSHIVQWLAVYEYSRYVVLAVPAAIAMALLGILAHSLHATGFVFIATVTNIALNYILFSVCIWLLNPTDAVEALKYFVASCVLALIIQVVISVLLFLRTGFVLPELFSSGLPRADYDEMYRTAVPLWLVVISQQLNMWGAQFVSSVYVEKADLALLAIAMRLAMVVPMIMTSVNLVVSPQFASLYHRGEIDKIREVLQKSLTLLGIVSLLVFATVLLFGDDLLRIFGSQYVEARVLLTILVCGQLFNAMTGPCGRLLMMSGYEKDIRNSSIVVAVLGLCLAFVLVRFYGIYGAALATAVTVATQNLYLAYLVNSRLKISLVKIYSNILHWPSAGVR